ncbi:hypothetical protein Q5P01_020917 [Channa striata]|uniref:Uncharacterized protein n=1 Tax=Channa striata TaxID=64152 RepID=A0AA88S2W7_CHASR|nr:hypothetical protein Q5P01_020917 [Channa striata]
MRGVGGFSDAAGASSFRSLYRITPSLSCSSQYSSGSPNSLSLLSAAHRRKAVQLLALSQSFGGGKWCRSTPPMNGPEAYSRAKKAKNQRNCPLKEDKDNGKDRHITSSAKHCLLLQGKEREGCNRGDI